MNQELLDVCGGIVKASMLLTAVSTLETVYQLPQYLGEQPFLTFTSVIGILAILVGTEFAIYKLVLDPIQSEEFDQASLKTLRDWVVLWAVISVALLLTSTFAPVLMASLVILWATLTALIRGFERQANVTNPSD